MDTIKNWRAMLALAFLFLVLVGIGHGEKPKPVSPAALLPPPPPQIEPGVPVPVMPVLPGMASHQKYDFFGPIETSSFEEALSRVSYAYDYGIWPREEKLKKALPADRIPEGTVKHLEKWLTSVLKKEVQPAEGNWNNRKWLGMPEFRSGSDYILGPLTSKNKDVKKIEFQATDRDLYISIHSDTLFPREIEKVDEAQAKAFLTSFLNLPEEAVKRMTVEHTVEKLGKDKTPTCCGCLYYFTDEWYRKVPFWFTKDRGFVSIPTLGKEEIEGRAIAVSRFPFKGLRRASVKGEPPVDSQYIPVPLPPPQPVPPPNWDPLQN